MILTSGVFDGLHAGHVAYLRAAAEHSIGVETLVVAVACDDYVRRVKHREPTWVEEERRSVLLALMIVDDAIIHNKAGAAAAIRFLRPRLFVKGQDWARNGLAPDVTAACIDVGCKIVYVDSGDFKHTSDALSTHQ